ncbi:centrosome and spindle pole-associated protein 1 isoform X2 [Esox lucius]|uniref:centrosome and spindle pole-associated protein 1 isoform X2 n=1 Tax=Esox lucius TaxID=8010 RepID=UPI0014771E24|nr:centrosome and spindle pole-associated protein 1 isoform X2 [Esox lucius]
MDDELDHFIQQHKARVAEDKTSLEKDPPPYLEIRKNDHKAYDSVLKENIPPINSSTAQEKEEGCCLNLPLGKDYERKKQKLQQELRLDYRRYMAQEYLHSLRNPPDITDAHCSPRPPAAVHSERDPLRRDTAMPTQGWRGLHRVGRRLVDSRRVEDLEPEDELPLPRERARPGRADLDSEEDPTEEEREMTEERRLRQTGLEMGEERRLRQTGLEMGEERRCQRHNKTDFRDIPRHRNKRPELHDDYIDMDRHADRKEASGSIIHDVDYLEAHLGTSSLTPKPKLQIPAEIHPSGRFWSSTNKDKPEFATGLMIGASDAEAASQRRKERYRQELLEQIAEQQRNRKREKDLELGVAATGVTDPEKRANRIRPLGGLPGGDHARKGDGSYRPGQAVDLSGDALQGRSSQGNQERLPPEKPRMAFQSPLLEYSHALGLGSGGISPYSQANSRSSHIPRFPGVVPHPPSTLADVYRTPYEDAYVYYGVRNPLDPGLAYYGQTPLIGGIQPMSYRSLPTAGLHPSQSGPHSQHSGTSPPELPASSAVTIRSGIGVFPAEQVKPSKESAVRYKEALRQQIHDQQERRRLEREERDRYEARLEADMKNHDPWGRGGGGAPLRDSGGNLITDLHQMHKHNAEAYINPETWQKRATSTMDVLREDTRPPSTHRVSGFVQAPSFARGSVFGNLPTPQQVNEQDKYKAYLKQQIEEKRRKEAEEKERQRLEEEREERRLAEQRESIQREYEDEQERKKRKEMEQKAKNEELIRLAEERKKEVESKKKEAEEKENAALRKQYEEERQARLEQVPREPSPPIPTLQKRRPAPQYTPRPPSTDSHRSTAAPLTERSLSGLQSPPVPARRNQLRAAEDRRGVISELSALRRQLRMEQKRLEGQLLQSEWELDSPGSERDRERPQVDVFDLARLRLQAPVRRPSSRTAEPNHPHRMHDSLHFRQRDMDSREDGYYESPRERDRDGQGVDIHPHAANREQQQHTVNSLMRTPAHDHFDLSSLQQQNHYLLSPEECRRRSN